LGIGNETKEGNFLEMKLLLIFLLFFTPMVFAKGKAKSKSRFPRIQMITGQALQVDETLRVVNRHPEKTEKEKTLKKGQVLKDKVILKTKEDSELWVELSEKATLILAAKTQIEFPAIAWQDGNVSEIRLVSGSFRYSCEVKCDRKLVTPLYEGVPPVGNYILSYDPAVPRTQLSVLAGEVPFRGIENENSVILHAGEFATFQGVLENNEPAFDVLLKGRRVAKGTLSDVQKIPAEDLAKFEKQAEAQKKSRPKTSSAKPKADQICSKPNGELNQCVWKCEKNKKNAKECRLSEGALCVRQRCNANGEWADRVELPSAESKCQVKPVVAACDY
jgi:hypothetical protein